MIKLSIEISLFTSRRESLTFVHEKTKPTKRGYGSTLQSSHRFRLSGGMYTSYDFLNAHKFTLAMH